LSPWRHLPDQGQLTSRRSWRHHHCPMQVACLMAAWNFRFVFVNGLSQAPCLNPHRIARSIHPCPTVCCLPVTRRLGGVISFLLMQRLCLWDNPLPSSISPCVYFICLSRCNIGLISSSRVCLWLTSKSGLEIDKCLVNC
jgi:hypothetical protein